MFDWRVDSVDWLWEVVTMLFSWGYHVYSLIEVSVKVTFLNPPITVPHQNVTEFNITNSCLIIFQNTVISKGLVTTAIVQATVMY